MKNSFQLEILQLLCERIQRCVILRCRSKAWLHSVHQNRVQFQQLFPVLHSDVISAVDNQIPIVII